MSRRVKMFGVVFFFLNTILISAESEDMLTWKDCLREAKENNPDLVSAKEQIRQSEADKAITKSSTLPQITGNLSGDRAGNAADTNSTYAYSVNAKQLLFDNFKTSSDIASASQTLTASQYNYLVVSSDVRLQLREAFVELLNAQELVSLTEDIVKRRRQNVELIRLRYKAGREHRGALLTAEADLAQAEFEVTRAKRNVGSSQRQLSKAMGRTAFTPIKMEENFAITEAGLNSVDFEHLADNSSLLKKLIARKESVRYALKSTKADFYPKVYLDASVGESSSEWSFDDNEWSVGFSVSLPLFEGGKRKAEISKAVSLLKQAEEDERSSRDEVVFTLAKTWTELQDAIEELSVQEKFLNAAEERAEISNAQYSTGLISFDDWVIIEDNLVKAKKDLLTVKTNVLTKQAYWYQAKGRTLEYE